MFKKSLNRNKDTYFFQEQMQYNNMQYKVVLHKTVLQQMQYDYMQYKIVLHKGVLQLEF